MYGTDTKEVIVRYCFSYDKQNQMLNISINESILIDQPWSLEVYNITSGEKMVSQNPSLKTLTFSTAGWKLGLYAIKVTLGKNSWSKKFINNR